MHHDSCSIIMDNILIMTISVYLISYKNSLYNGKRNFIAYN